MSLNVSMADRERVEELLGRSPECAFDVVVRDASGDPVVIRNAPLTYDGRPMPTRFWLVGEALPIIGIHPFCLDAGDESPPRQFWAHAQCMPMNLSADLQQRLCADYVCRSMNMNFATFKPAGRLCGRHLNGDLTKRDCPAQCVESKS